MKIKRILCLLATVLLLMSAVISPLSVSAIVTANSGKLEVLPGNTQSASPVYSKAWLDNVIIRDDAAAFKGVRIVPKGEYPYSHTYDEFVTEVNHYALLNELNVDTVAAPYETIIEMTYYLVTAAGMTADMNSMLSFLSAYGIKVPANMTAEDKVKVSVVYAAIKNNAVYVLFEKTAVFAKGISLDAACVVILAALTGVSLPSGIDTISGFALLCIKNYVNEFDSIPISDNPDANEVFHWVKILTASKQSYGVPLTPYDVATDYEKMYVDFAYYASIFDTAYGVHLDPIELVKADYSSDYDAIAKLIVTTMLDEKCVSYDKNSKCENLFDLACKNGCFMLEEEFYSDIFEYDLYVDKNCEKLWFTPFALADQIDASNEFVSIKLEGKEMKPSATAYAPLDPKKDKETVELVVSYDDAKARPEAVTYKFNCIKVENTETSGDNGIVSQIEDAVRSAVPQDNEKANSVVNEVIDSVNSALITKPDSSADNDVTISTYPDDTVTKAGYTGEAEAVSGDIDFEYLKELLSETYQSTTAYYPEADEQDSEDASIIEKAVATVKENPQIVAAPTGIIAVGGFAGYFLNKKRKTAVTVDDEKSTSSDE